jgi:hypothetical protein
MLDASATAWERRPSRRGAFQPPLDSGPYEKAMYRERRVPMRVMVIGGLLLTLVVIQFLLAEAYKVAIVQQQQQQQPTPQPTVLLQSLPTPALRTLVALPVQTVAKTSNMYTLTPATKDEEDVVDVLALEEQLRELDNLQQSLNDTAAEDALAPPDIGLEKAATKDLPPLPPLPLDAVHGKPSGHHGVAADHSSSSSSSDHRHHTTQHKHCRSRAALFKSAVALPALVAFPVLSRHHSAVRVEAVWRRAFARAGFQETENPELATYLISKQSLDSRLPYGEACSDSQMFNHVRGLRSMVDPISLARLDLGPNMAAFWGASTSSARKAMCSSFMASLHDQLSGVRTVDALSAWAEKKDAQNHYGKTVTRLSVRDMRKMLDLFKKSGTCPHHDDVVVSRRFRDVFTLDQALPQSCGLKAFLYVASTRPLLAFLSTKFVIAKCVGLDEESAELPYMLVGAHGEAANSTSSQRYLPVLMTVDELKDRIERQGRTVGPLCVHDSAGLGLN